MQCYESYDYHLTQTTSFITIFNVEFFNLVKINKTLANADK